MDQYIDDRREIEIRRQQMSAAAAFFQKTSQYIANERSKSKKDYCAVKFLYNFHKINLSSLLRLPPCLQKNASTTLSSHRKDLDKIHVFVHLVPCVESCSYVSIDKANNTITFTDPTPSRRFTASNAPKSFPVDTVINEDCPLIEICSSTLKNVIRSVANGEDACVLSFGNISTAEQNPMLGSDKSSNTMGIIPCAIVWLFNYINTLRQHENSRFSLRISATEVSENQEVCRDLLTKACSTFGDQYTEGSFSPSNTSVELRAVDVEKTLFYLDYALTERSKSDTSGLSHMLVTLHLYQYHMRNVSGISGGRSCLHLIDLAHGRLSENSDSTALSIQGISKVIMALWSGQRHIPNSESHLTQLLRRTLMSNNGRIQTSMIFNISGKEVQYNEALQVVQLASKIFRQKAKLTKLSSSILSDDNSSLDSFTMRRMYKSKEQRLSNVPNDNASISSDIDATSSSEVSCDTVIYRGQRQGYPPVSDRGLADGSSQEKIKLTELQKKPDTKLSLFQQKRKGTTKASCTAWPKDAVKKGLQAKKSGQELWVDGPQAFCTDVTLSEKNEEMRQDDHKAGTDAAKHTTTEEHHVDTEVFDANGRRTKVQLKGYNKGQQSDQTLAPDRYINDNVLKSMMVSNWLSKQPEIPEEVNRDLIPQISSLKKSRFDPVDPSKSHIEGSDRKMTLRNLSRIEEWIKSVSIDSPKRNPSVTDCEVVMTQSLYSPTCSPYHLSHGYQPSPFTATPLSPPSAPRSYNPTSIDVHSNSRGFSVPPASMDSEIENENSRLWFFNHPSNERHFNDPFDDMNTFRSSSFSTGVGQLPIRQEPIRRSCHRPKVPNPATCEIPLSQHDHFNLQKYSTLPLDLYSPKHKKDSTKVSEKNDVNEIIESKRSTKDFKKKETKKGFSFFNQLIRIKKSKKDLSANRPRREEQISKVETSTNDFSTKSLMTQTEFPVKDSIEYTRRAGPPLLLSSPYHMVTSPNTFHPRADSSGHGSDCSSFNGVKTAQVSVNFHPETSSFRFAACHRAGSSGYESVVRDSELSSHNDSASECSAPANVLVQSPSVQKNFRDISTAAVSTPLITPTHPPLSINPQDIPEFLSHSQESRKVAELVIKEKLDILQAEREDTMGELIRAMTYYNIDRDTSRKDMEKCVLDMDGPEPSPETMRLTNQMLRSVLNRYQSNICLVTSFLSKPDSET